MNLEDLDWNLLRVFLAMMRAKSLREAADSLDISHPTARRHLGHLEEQLGMKLFERRRDGLHPTAEAAELEHAAESEEAAVYALSRVAKAADPGRSMWGWPRASFRRVATAFTVNLTGVAGCHVS